MFIKKGFTFKHGIEEIEDQLLRASYTGTLPDGVEVSEVVESIRRELDEGAEQHNSSGETPERGIGNDRT